MKFALCALAFLWLLTGCEMTPEEELAYMYPPPPGELLTHDPTEAFEISQWWTNGSELLRLNEDASFALFNSLNRYHTPQEHGRWSKQSYAVMLLEPYSLLPQERVRVGITRTDGELTLDIPKLKPMFAIEGAPAVIEDGLIGMWLGPQGEIFLASDLRYTYSRESATGAGLARHRGRWELSDNTLQLHPDVLAMGTFEFELVTGETGLVLASPRGDYEYDATAKRKE